VGAGSSGVSPRQGVVLSAFDIQFRDIDAITGQVERAPRRAGAAQLYGRAPN